MSDELSLLDLMTIAIEEAEKASNHGDIPVGAIVLDPTGKIISKAHNEKESEDNSLAHAELSAILQALTLKKGSYLTDCTLIVTLEPCAMCAGAIVAARIKTLVFGASDPKGGACGSLMNIVDDPRLNHRVDVIHGILNLECSRLLTEFFDDKRH